MPIILNMVNTGILRRKQKSQKSSWSTYSCGNQPRLHELLTQQHNTTQYNTTNTAQYSSVEYHCRPELERDTWVMSVGSTCQFSLREGVDVFQSSFSHLKLDIKYMIFNVRYITFWRHVNNIHSQLINEDSQQNYLAKDCRHVPRLQWSDCSF